ncbi:DNA methyltransferase [Thalassotalea sp. SU-HH00458]|uniref:DNA methyltransferase n=1 Tax=Thalassotalea sp. SU-HH00458 TaxID=3127657 RepID=UPI003102119A
MSKYNELVKKLKEIFQIDRPELDFGIYRILNAKADEINNYLENTLKQKISDALATAGNANKAELEKQLSSAIKAAEDAGFNPEDSPKVKDLRQQIITTSQGANEHENAVFTHLLSFFSRYYDSGDFVSKRRYKGDTYAIPYAGEEVMLHWANKDQYYIKSGENFANYSFKLDDGRKVSFKLLAADTAKDNRKDNDADRRFVLIEPHTRTKFDEEGNEFEEEYQPVTVVKSEGTEELVIQFEYKTVKKGTKQDVLVTDALKTIMSNQLVQSTWADITKREPTEKNPNRTLLEKHLTTYTQRNTADYFIHKDLGGFLSNELDFYIKNEVMNLDNVQNAEVFADIEKQLRMIQCLRSISKDIISFLSQLENFQKKLWTKKKFVIKADFLATIDIVPEELYTDVVKNDEQWNEWEGLGFTFESKDKNTLLNSPYLMLNTRLFDSEFYEKLLISINNLEEKIDGYLYHSDNYQALNLLNKKYNEKINCIYIDPPYNSPSSEIAYKNSFKHSSWLTLMDNRLEKSKSLISEDAGVVIAIDKYEQNGLERLLKQNFSSYKVTNIPVEHNKKGVQGDGFSFTNEFAVFAVPDLKGIVNRKTLPEIEWEYDNLRNWGGESLRTDGKTCFYPIIVKNDKVIGFGDVCEESFSPDSANVHQADGSVWVYPIDKKGIERKWRFARDTVEKIIDILKVKVSNDGLIQIEKAKADAPYKTVWYSSLFNAGDYGTKVLTDMGFDKKLFDFPKSVHTVIESISAICKPHNDNIVLDYFAGSGTTAQAVKNINLKNNTKMKFKLVEQGEYFNTVIIPRIQKMSYTLDWKGGKPVNNEGGSQLVKVVTLESYEDTLNNLEIKKTQQTSDLFEMMNEEAKSNYLLNYMLETESKGSLLSTDDFKKPFNYKMKIAVDSAGASEEQNIDLVETFNYLIGLHVKTIESNLDKGYVRIEGTLPSGERALVLWRDCEKIQYDDFTKFAIRFDLFAKQKTFDVIYVNGDHNLPTAFTNDEDDVTRTLKLRQIEPEFLEQMFAPDELA